MALRYEQVDRVVELTLGRPPVNALDLATVREFDQAIDRIAGDGEVGCVLVRAAGDRAFCAGADIGMIQRCLSSDAGRDEMMRFVAALNAMIDRLESLDRPTVAVLERSATGGGLELALACDLRVAARGARFGLTEVRIGLLPGGGGTQRLTRIAGRAVASRAILTGELMTAEAAREWGVISEVTPDGAALSRARDLARTLSLQSRAAMAEIKRCIALAPSADGHRAEVDGTKRLLSDPRTTELISGFLSARR